ALRGRRGLPTLALAPDRDRHPRLGGLEARPPARHRHDLGLPGPEPARDPALRGRLPARLPRSRGDGDGAPAPPAAPRGARADARAHGRPLLDHRLPLGLLHGEGPARPLRRDLPPQRRPTGGSMTPLGISIAAALVSLALLV